MNIHITTTSRNKKTGPIPVTTSGQQSCPANCPFATANNGGCYATSGPIALHWRAVTEGKRGLPYDEFTDTVRRFRKGTLWRHNQAGDLAHNAGIIDAGKLQQLATANKGKQGFTYTHHNPYNDNNAMAIANANLDGFAVNLSGNNPQHATELKALNIAPVVSVVGFDFWQGKNKRKFNGQSFVRCPAEYNDSIDCANCGACAVISRDSVIGFTAHGTSKKKANQIAAVNV